MKKVICFLFVFFIFISVSIEAKDPYGSSSTQRNNLIPPGYRVSSIIPYPTPLNISVRDIIEIYAPGPTFNFWTIITNNNVYLLSGERKEYTFEFERKETR